MREVRLPASEKSCVIHKCYPGTFHHVRVYSVGVDDALITRSSRLTVQTSAPPEPPNVSLRYLRPSYITYYTFGEKFANFNEFCNRFERMEQL